MNRIDICRSLVAALVLSAIGRHAAAGEPRPLLTTSDKLLLSEDFAGEGIPSTFRTLQTPDSFRLVDGALELSAKAGQERATHGALPVAGHNITVAFSVTFDKPVALYVGIDGYKEEFKGNTHLVRFGLTPERMAWDEKRGGPESKHAVSEAMKAARAAKKPLPKATAEQLADPKFFRTEALTERKIDCAVGRRHEVLLEINGNDLVAQVDGVPLLATATVADSAKNRIGIGLTGRGTARIDHVRVWENTRRADWAEVKAKLAASTEKQP